VIYLFFSFIFCMYVNVFETSHRTVSVPLRADADHRGMGGRQSCRLRRTDVQVLYSRASRYIADEKYEKSGHTEEQTMLVHSSPPISRECLIDASHQLSTVGWMQMGFSRQQ
jgi:hypothetical protein